MHSPPAQVNKKSYRIASGKIYELSLNHSSDTEEGQAVMRFDPYLWINGISSTQVFVNAKFMVTIISGDEEAAASAIAAAGMDPDILANTATDLSESGRLDLTQYPSLESVLESNELSLRNALTTWQDSARAKGLEWQWAEEQCHSVKPHNLHSALIKRSHVDNSYAMWREQSITLKPTAEESRLPTLPGINPGSSPDTERLHLFPTMRKARSVFSDGNNLCFFTVTATHPQSSAL